MIVALVMAFFAFILGVVVGYNMDHTTGPGDLCNDDFFTKGPK